MKEKFISQKGITLIALIITIIVLLILAGVTIAQITGNESSMNKAVEAKEANDLGAMRDEIALIVSTSKISTNTFKQDLQAQYGANAIEEIGEEGHELTHVFYLTKKGKEYTVFENGDVEAGKVDVWDGRSYEKPEIDSSNNWHIYTPKQLNYFEKFVNQDTNLSASDKEDIPAISADTVVYLENDLDMGAREIDGNWEVASNTMVQWKPIGKTYDNRFLGTFDGKEHIIKGIYVNETSENAGLFGDSNITQNLIIKDSYVKNTSYLTGGLVGVSRGKISNCKNINTTVVGGKYEYGTNVLSYTGGIVGQSNSNKIIEKCSNSGKVYVENDGICVGGIVGVAMKNNQIKECENKGDVNAYDAYSVGGIVGHSNAYVTIDNCQNYGKITGLVRVGGITGVINNNSIVEKCYNTGKINGTQQVGGILGLLTGTKGNETVQYCYNKGEVTGTTNVGEMIGCSDCTTIVDEIVSGSAGNVLKDLVWLQNSNSLPGIGNISLTTEQETSYNIKSTTQSYETVSATWPADE